MAVQNTMFIFEVVLENVESLVESRNLVIKGEFADIFSLELKDPKQMHIVMPEPPPLPPEPPGKKKKKPPKKKGKVVVAPVAEPVIQSGQSILFSSNAEFLIQNMYKCPLEISLWNKEDCMSFIGSNGIPWDPAFIFYLENLANGVILEPVTLGDTYNIFEEGQARIMAKMTMQVKLSYLGDKVCTSFRTLSEDPSVKKCLYTGINSKVTSYMCTMKTTDEDFEQNCNKIENNFVIDKPKPPGKIVYADYKNAPGANLTFFNDGDYCCMGQADKPPESIYKSPETCPDVNYITDYVRKIILSCNDNMRMLTPRPLIRPMVKATDIDRLCYCKEIVWPESELADRFKKEAQSEPCPVCARAGKKPTGSGLGTGETFDVAKIRGPCGRTDCRIARDLRSYIENLVEEDNKEFNINDVIGPCGSKTCTLAEKIQQFLRHEGEFSKASTLEGLTTQCACIQTMQKALLKKKSSCDSVCSRDCKDIDDEANLCKGDTCPFGSPKSNVYNVYYFTVEHDFEKNPSNSGTSTPEIDQKYKSCASSCPSVKAEKATCSKSACSSLTNKIDFSECSNSNSICKMPVCPSHSDFPPSPADSNVVIQFKDIINPCRVKSCDVAEKVKDFIVDAVKSAKKTEDDDSCYCDCVCSFKLANKHTTYCAVCGGYERLGEDMMNQPEYCKPYPCPVYHKLYDRKIIKTTNIWPEDDEKKPPTDTGDKISMTSRTAESTMDRKMTTTDARSLRGFEKIKEKEKPLSKKKSASKPEQKKVGKFTANVEEHPTKQLEKKPESKYPYPAVPKNMGWNWTAEDIPGMKPRPEWKPGAVNKVLVRKYRSIRGQGTDVTSKKKRAMMQKKKIEKPTLIVSKRDGEYTVQMEVFKQYPRPRYLCENPYADKPPLIYTIGKTELEREKIKKKRDRQERREFRRRSRLLQSTFRDKCQEICLKAYNQAIGILPLPNANSPECPCDTIPAASPPIDSCSCSEEGSISSSDTDNDEWTIEFSPPAARYDNKAPHPPILEDAGTQYTYLDYKVKLLDKSGKQVPRFFKGPNGNQECSDLGGFWSPDHRWLEINLDGYIGPDCRWVPMSFIGPDGNEYSAATGTFTDKNGQSWKIGVDGYVNKEGKWAWYKRTTPTKNTKATTQVTKSVKVGNPEPAEKSKMDVKKPKEVAQTKSKTIQNKNGKEKKAQFSAGKQKSQFVMSALVNSHYESSKMNRMPLTDRMKLEGKKLGKYKEIMQELQMYDDFYGLKPVTKTNRATQDSPKKKISTFRAVYRNVSQSYKSSTSCHSFVNS